MSDESATGQPRFNRYPPLARPGFGVPTAAADPPASDDHPPIELFLDELPSIEDYLSPGAERDDAQWTMDDWQSYDWSALAALRRAGSGNAEADAAWESTSWTADQQDVQSSTAGDPEDFAEVRSPGGPDADEVAAALDAIARRIRSGELPIDQFRGMPPEAAMAAALASLLKMRG